MKSNNSLSFVVVVLWYLVVEQFGDRRRVARGDELIDLLLQLVVVRPSNEREKQKGQIVFVRQM
jgi:hypothetical protein